MSDLFNKDGPDSELPPELPDEQQLEEYLRGGSAVSRQYRQLPGADVPADLDRLVLRQAEQAVEARPAKSRKWVRWTGPLALAASAVLVVSIVIESGVHNEYYLSAPASAPAEVSMQYDFAESPAGASAEKRAVEAEKLQDQPSVVPIVPVQPPPAASPRFAPEAPALESSAPAPDQDQSLAVQRYRPLPPPMPAPLPVPKVAEPAPIEEAQVRGFVDRRHEVPQNSISAPVTASRSDEQLEEVIMTGARRRENKQTAGPRNTVVPATADAQGNSAEQEADEPRSYSDPEQWLRDIRELRKQNKQEEADREWRRFRSVFPNYAVAEDDAARGVRR